MLSQCANKVSLASVNCRRSAPHVVARAQPTRRDVLVAAPLVGGLLVAEQVHAKPAVRDPADWSSPGLSNPVPDDAPKFIKTASGVRVQELALGSGPEATPNSTVLFDYILRRSNGYFIYGTVEGVSFQPRDVPTGPVSFKLGEGVLIQGLEEVLIGMRPGAKRRALIPPDVGYTTGAEPQPPTFATKRQLDNHKNEALIFEVQLLRVDGAKA